MTKEEALEKSIQKWDSIADGIGIDCGFRNCALCKLYIMRRSYTCKGCPVSDFTGAGCCGSPYDKWYYHQLESHIESEFLCHSAKSVVK